MSSKYSLKQKKGGGFSGFHGSTCKDQVALQSSRAGHGTEMSRFSTAKMGPGI